MQTFNTINKIRSENAKIVYFLKNEQESLNTQNCKNKKKITDYVIL